MNFLGEAVAHLRGRGVEVDVVSPATFRALRDRLRLGSRRQPAPRPVAGRAAPGDALELPARGRAAGAEGRPDPRALAPERRDRGDLRAAVRRPALGHRRRARAEGAAARPLDPAAGAADDLPLERARGRGARAGRARGARDPERGGGPGRGGRGGRAAGGALRGTALAREGHPRARGGGEGDEARRRRRRAAARLGCRARSGSSRTTTSARCTSGRRSSRARRTARGSASSARRRWPTGGRWSRARSAGSSTWSWTARPACSCRRATWARCGRRSSGCSATASFGSRLGAAARERIRERFAWPAVTDATLAAYEEALAGVRPAVVYGAGSARRARDRAQPRPRRDPGRGHRAPALRVRAALALPAAANAAPRATTTCSRRCATRARGGERPVLFLERDENVETVLRRWDEVRALADVPLPDDPEAVRRLRRKDLLPAVAAEAGVPSPRTVRGREPGVDPRGGPRAAAPAEAARGAGLRARVRREGLRRRDAWTRRSRSGSAPRSAASTRSSRS